MSSTPYTQGLNGSAGAFVFLVSASDADIGQNGVVQYFLFGAGSQYVSINQSTGEIRVAGSDIDFEVVNGMGNPLVLTLIAQDNGKFYTILLWDEVPSNNTCVNCCPGTPIRFAASSINITVTDSNDNAPVFANTPYSVTLPEGVVQTRQLVLNVTATDADSGSNGEVVYSIAGGTSGDFQLDPLTVDFIVEPIITPVVNSIKCL